MQSLQKGTLIKVKYFNLGHWQRKESKMEQASQDCELKVVEVKWLVGEPGPQTLRNSTSSWFQWSSQVKIHYDSFLRYGAFQTISFGHLQNS